MCKCDPFIEKALPSNRERFLMMKNYLFVQIRTSGCRRSPYGGGAQRSWDRDGELT